MEERDRVRLTGLWKKPTRDGGFFLSGKMGDCNLLIFKNGRKKGAKEPDYEAFLVPSRPPASTERNPAGPEPEERQPDF